ncbi:MAG TPA: putative transporter [Saprospirales bacterium]|nr:putative transporter [Saprospirales bacterium]HAY71438.1 putative transporter [Saprospirales bacterium]HRQ28678.1 putative transporter [Saprospiraceae bacterium]
MIDTILTLIKPTDHPSVTQSLIVVMLVVAVGIFMGNLKIRKISFGMSAIMFSGLILGHYGYTVEHNTLEFLRDFGLVLFVYGIGIQVGVSFFSSLKNDGLKFNLLAIFTILLGGLVAIIIFMVSGQSIENVVGMMSGAVTNTPGLGAAKSVLVEFQQQFPDRKFADPAVAYAITYPFGVFGIILLMIMAKKLLRIDIKKEHDAFITESVSNESVPIVKKVRITNEEPVGKTLKEIVDMFGKEKVIFSRLKRTGSTQVLSPSAETVLEFLDVLMMVGYKDDLDKIIAYLGRESSDTMVEKEEGIIAKTLIVTNNAVVHKTLEDLDMYNRYDLKVTRIFRSGRELLAHPKLNLFFGDKIAVVGNKWSVQQAEKMIGNSEKKLLEPDFFSIFGGLILGIIVGSIPFLIPSFPVPIKLGFAAGPLLVALFLSRYGGIGMIHTYINHGAIHFMKDMGISLFFATVGIYAGKHFYENFVTYNGWEWIGYGALITFIPLIFMVIIGRFVMKINFLKLIGIMSATYTDPAALSFSNQYFNSDIPTQSYVTVYPMATIMRILIAQLLILILASGMV